jgi:hypothetical protein
MGQRMQAVCLLLPIEEGVVEGALCQAIPYRCQLSRRQEYEADVTLEKYLQNCDPKLHCLKNGDDQELSQNIERLLQEADPLIKKEIRSRLNPEEFEVKGEDIYADVCVACTKKMRQVAQYMRTLQHQAQQTNGEDCTCEPVETEPVERWDGYARIVARNRVVEEFCADKRDWCRMKERLNYLFKISPKLKILRKKRARLKQAHSEIFDAASRRKPMGALSIWTFRNMAIILPRLPFLSDEPLHRLQQNAQEWMDDFLEENPNSHKVDEALVVRILETVGIPVNFDELVTLCVVLAAYLPPRIEEEKPIRLFNELVNKQFLQLFWDAIKTLSLQQKQSILYNFDAEIRRLFPAPEKYSLIQHFFENLDAVSYDDVAMILNLEEGQIYLLLDALPMDTKTIAQCLETTPNTIKVSRSRGMAAIKANLRKRLESREGGIR